MRDERVWMEGFRCRRWRMKEMDLGEVEVC